MQGFQHVLKAMGIDPEEIQNQVRATVEGAISAVAAHFEELGKRLDMIDKRLQKIENYLIEHEKDFITDDFLEQNHINLAQNVPGDETPTPPDRGRRKKDDDGTSSPAAAVTP